MNDRQAYKMTETEHTDGLTSQNLARWDGLILYISAFLLPYVLIC